MAIGRSIKRLIKRFVEKQGRCSRACYLGRQPDGTFAWDPSSEFEAYVEPSYKTFPLGEANTISYSHLMITEVVLEEGDRVWLPGDDVDQEKLAYKVGSCEPITLPRTGEVSHYEVLIGPRR